MSGAADDRWHGGGRAYDQNRQSGQRNSNPRAMSAHGGPRGGQQNANASTLNWADSMDQEQHTPVGGFNAGEAKAALRRGMVMVQEVRTPFYEFSTILHERVTDQPLGPKPFFYKPQGKDANNRGNGPWGSKPNTMANGKDFFLELRKQITAVRQGGAVAGG
ncbi:hypothetical protein BJX70DRAFT_396830 [Aspergillus crustosus]